MCSRGPPNLDFRVQTVHSTRWRSGIKTANQCHDLHDFKEPTIVNVSRLRWHNKPYSIKASRVTVLPGVPCWRTTSIVCCGGGEYAGRREARGGLMPAAAGGFLAVRSSKD